MKRDPKNFKYKRTFKFVNKVEHFEPAMCHVNFSAYGLVATKDTFLNYEQLFTVYRLLKKKLKRKHLFRFNWSCVLPFTKKPVSARMGKGKGAWRYFIVLVRKGSILVELRDIDELLVKFLFAQCAQRLPVKTKILKFKI